MIVDHLNHWKNYFKNPVWETIFCELAALDKNTPEMEKKIRGDDIILKVFSYATIDLNLPQFTGHFKKYTESYTMEKKGVSDEKAETVV